MQGFLHGHIGKGGKLPHDRRILPIAGQIGMAGDESGLLFGAAKDRHNLPLRGGCRRLLPRFVQKGRESRIRILFGQHRVTAL